MAARRVKRPALVSSLSVRDVADPAAADALTQVEQAVQRVQRSFSRVVVAQDLVTGRNVVRHGLGRAAQGYTITATVADATFAHAIDRTNPNPNLEIWVNVLNVAQPGAVLEIW